MFALRTTIFPKFSNTGELVVSLLLLVPEKVASGI
jgi:hypothetical protein